MYRIRPDNNRPPRIAIVGGGPGGLFTAWHLEQHASAPIDLTIFEASDRLGGKLVTPVFISAPVRYEAGAAELYDYEPVGDDALRDLVRALGLATIPLAGAAVRVDDRWIANLDDLTRDFSPTDRDQFLKFDMWARGAMTPREFYESGSDHAADACPHDHFHSILGDITSASIRRYVETSIHSDLATEPDTTTVAYGLQNYLMNDPDYMRLYRIAGGNEQIATAVASGLAATVRLGARVTEVASRSDGRLDLVWQRGDHMERKTFDVVIVALPVNALSAMTFSGESLAPAIERHVTHHDHPAHYLRISLLLDGPVPSVPGGDDFLMVDAFGGACLYVETARDPVTAHGVLGWLVGGKAARTMAARPNHELVAAALDALPPPLDACKNRVLEARVHRWVGAVSAVPGGWKPLPVAARHRPAPEEPAFFVVGDYLFDSTLNGVLDSAEYVASWVATELADTHSGSDTTAFA
jgi:predicted NAD/FAD-dependent oxidoreductase